MEKSSIADFFDLRFDVNYVYLQVETQFGIVIPHKDERVIRSMGQLFHFVLAKVGLRPQHFCTSSAIFYRLRKALGESIGVPPKRVRTNSHMEEFFPVRERKRHWQQFCAAMGNVYLPYPRRPRWLTWLLQYAFALGMAVPMFSGGALYKLGGYSPWLWGTLIAIGIPMGIVVLWMGNRITRNWEICIPPSCTTVRDVVYTLLGQSTNRVVSDESRPNDAEIWSILCGIVGDEFDMQPSSITLDSHPWAA